MTGQISMFDLLPKEPPAMNEPGVYSRSGRQRVTMERVANYMKIAIWTDDEAMICLVEANEFFDYLKGVQNGQI